jgi:hypothetical protein
VHTTQQWGRCFNGKCNWKHRYAIVPVLKQLGISAEVTGVEKAPDSGNFERVEFPKDFQVLTRVYDDLDCQAKKYILDRGITEEQIRENRIGVSYGGRYAYRILFPVFVDKELKAINARTFTDSTPKYLNSRGEKYLFRFDPKQEVTILSEGAIKALRIAQVTDSGSASLLGHDLTDIQLQQISESSCKHLVLYPDPDSVGRKGTVHVAEKLVERWKNPVSIVWPVRLPADEAPLEELQALITNNLVPYTWGTRARLLLK